MQYIKTNGDDTYIEYDKATRTSRVIVKCEIEKKVREAKERLTQIPAEPTDRELLEWAREHYDGMDYSAEKKNLEQIISEGETTLAGLK